MLSIQDIKSWQRKLGELRRLATVSRPDVCDRLARIASHANPTQGSDAYRTNDLVKTVNVWQQAAILKYLPSSRVGKSAQELDDGEMGNHGTSWLVGSRIWR